ncbi:FAD-dependent oxidoreductase [Lactobacillus kefiranofaciens subsp. kefirgranum]|uniref:NAD(P)/FAD-dependent oxidoreductase n=1 Tax=Lactobacillus kefiranofaciens TaxID=267818 RepID=UPI0006F0807A|nr:FAD-dependent oxidoreductase [Lactobacillus kefiranofaciens]KRL23717.1 NADH dehydrogenase [Lactobacillus kefiranofaciens subsp. kefirgranum DSM 10550 = JCM 8572]
MKTIVVLGAGYAGLKTVVALQKKLREEVKIILVDRNPYHYETMRLYEVASGQDHYTRMSYELADVLNKKMTELVVDEVEKININDKNVELKNHALISYDYLVVGLGFVLSDMGIAGAKGYALPMSNVKEAEAIRDHLYEEMWAYSKYKDPKHLQIVICGAGFQAIELAGALAQVRPHLAKMAGVDQNQIKITMLDGSLRLLPMFQGKLLDYALGLIKKHQIEIIKPAFVQQVTADSVSYKMKDSDEIKTIKAGNRIWMMGFSGSPIIDKSGFKNRRGRVMVSDHLTAPESDDIYVLGDVSSVMVPGKKWPWPNTAQMALSMANYAAKDIRSRVNHQARPSKYVYHDLGVVVAIGETKAAGKAMGHGYKGYLASALKKIIIDKSLMETGGIKETLAVGRFDLYH